MMKTYLLILLVTSIVYVGYGVNLKPIGGWSDEENPDSPSVKEAAKFATEKVSASTNSMQHLRVSKISNIQKQVVSGINYKMTVTMKPTECKKIGNNTLLDVEKCPFLECGIPTICDVTVWVQVWNKENPRKLTKDSCTQGEAEC